MFWVDLTFEGYGDAMVFCVFILFRSNIRKRYLDENNFRDSHGNIFESAIPKYRFTWSQLC